ncbi:MAG: radical SAM protein [Coriobacteriia bacterium]|nr:radical SAM protein [Coriobacteriia bacterium]MBN2840827.1 radical SAM protein [Coriobacteriia bacterium]
MDATPRYSFGPVPSRRLGRSLGVNNIPAKTCTYSCVYCQVGRTSRMTMDRQVLYPPADIVSDVTRRVEEARIAGERIDYLAFVPDGEPTLDANLGDEIEGLQGLGIPVAVITNGSLLWREDVRRDLSQADWVSVKVDTVDEAIWRAIDRPHRSLDLAKVLEGVRSFAAGFRGELATETMLVTSLNDSEEGVRAVAEFVGGLHPSRAYLSIPTRPPAESWLPPVPDEQMLNTLFQRFAEVVPGAEYLIGYEGDEFASTGDIEADLLCITAVHPMRSDAVQAMLDAGGHPPEVLERLIERGDLVRTGFGGHTFYLRRLPGLPRR